MGDPPVAFPPTRPHQSQPGLAQALDSRSRALPLNVLGEGVLAASVALLAGADIAFLKVDSLLRGHVTSNVATLLEHHSWRRVILAPALPEQGRVLVNGRVQMGNRLVDHARLDLPGAQFVTCERLRSDPEAIALEGIHVVDSVDEEDLRCVAAALGVERQTLWIGSSGLAAALAQRHSAVERVSDTFRPRASRRVLVLVGSMTSVARRQVENLAGTTGIQHVRLTPSAIRNSSSTPMPASIPDHLVVSVTGEAAAGEGDPEVVRRLAGGVLSLECDFDAVVLVGGETARAALEAFGVDQLCILGELEPGVVLATDQRGRPFVTRSGSFGDDDSLTRTVAMLAD